MFYHKKETPNLNTEFFNRNKYKLKNIPKTLIISTGSRNGNHLIWSLLDGNKNIPYLPGEDKFLSQIFWRNLKSSKVFIKDLIKFKSFFLRKMSGLKSDKWQRIYKENINKKTWAGKHKSTIMPLVEFPKSKNIVNYPAYKKYLEKNFNNHFDFFGIWDLYLRAQKLLTNNKNKDLKYKFIYAESGLRRELLYLAQNNLNFVCVVPIRKFETFYFSKIKSKYNSIKITKKFLKEAWEQWYHKTSDYVYLKKRFPKKFFLVPFEDFENIETREEAIRKVCNFLQIKFEKINLKNTQYKKSVLPNSSFIKKIKIFENKSKMEQFNLKFPEEKLPKNYLKFYDNFAKFFYQKENSLKIDQIYKIAPCVKESKYKKEVKELLLNVSKIKINRINNFIKINIAFKMAILFRKKIDVDTKENPINIFKKFLISQSNFVKKNKLSNLKFKKVKTKNINYYNTFFKNLSTYEYYSKSFYALKTRLKRNGYNFNGLNKKIALDAGCGTGRYSYALKKIGYKKIIGIDHSNKNINLANKIKSKNNFDNLFFKNADVTKMPFKEDTFDFVFSNGVIHHTKNYDKCIKELIRVLKKGGCGYLNVMPNPGGIHWDIIEICRYLLKDISINQCYNFFIKKKMHPNLVYLFLDHMKVPINIRLKRKKILEMLRKNGAKKIRVLKRGTNYDYDEKIFKKKKFAKIKYGDGFNRIYFEK